MDPLWYKTAIIYELHIKCFLDASGDGIGDFKGLTQKLDYLADLGITAIWLLPFYPSPLKDDGYDIANYSDVHPHYGDLKDFREFLRQAHIRKLKVITELVINHTSDQHPWFQRARKKDATPQDRNFYVWNENPDKFKEARIIFQDFEPSNWTWDREAHCYFWHRFYSHQPDLNFDNPEVHKAVLKNLSFWFKMGVDGLRLDAIPYLYEREGTNCENLQETHAFLKKLRKFVDSHFEERVLIAEANQWPEDAAKYFGEGDECHMAFHFPVMPRLFMAIHLEDSLPIIEIMGQTPSIPSNCQWALFLRNHDELTLEMVTDEERDYMYRVYAYDPQARLNLGIRRRLAPLLKNDRRKMELMNALLFSLHGTPVIYYGDEIGMGDNIYLGDRNGVRTPMQWNSDKNAGFSRANPQQLYLPPIIDPEYHYETVNVEAQLNNPHSLLWWTKQLIALRKRYKAFSLGKTEFLVVENRKVLVFFREYGEELILIITNLARFPQYVELDLKQYQGYSLIEMFSGERFPQIGELPYFLTLGAYGYYWFVLEKQPLLNDLTMEKRKKEKQINEIVLTGVVRKIFLPNERKLLENLTRKYLLKQSWFHPFLSTLEKTNITISDAVALKETQPIHLVLVELLLLNGFIYHIPLFLSLFDAGAGREKMESHAENVVAVIKNEQTQYILYNSIGDAVLANWLLGFINQKKKLKSETGYLRGVKVSPITETVNIKFFPVLEEGMDPDIEMRLFLAQKTDFKSFLPLAGYLEYIGHDKKTLAIAEAVDIIPLEFNTKHAFVEAADLFFLRMQAVSDLPKDEILLPRCSLLDLAFGDLNPFLRQVLEGHLEVCRSLGETAADFHLAMRTETYNPIFSAVHYTLFYQRSLVQAMRRKTNEAFSVLAKQKKWVEILPLKERLISCMARFQLKHLNFERLRHHGNFVLENLYNIGKDNLITNFGGDPKLTFAERKYKRSPLRDVAAMLLSIADASFEGKEKAKARGMIANQDESHFNRWAFIWAIWMGSSFIRAYFRKLKDPTFFSNKKEEIDFILGIFLLERCLDRIISPGYNLDAACLVLQYWLPIYEEFNF